MFDSSRYEALGQAVDEVARLPVPLADGEQTRTALLAVQAASDRLEGVRAMLLEHLEETGAYADDGAASSLAWARRHLRLSDATTRRLRAAGHTMRVLPEVGQAMRSGEIRLDHVARFTSGVRRIDREVLADATEHILLPLAKQATPSDLAAAIDRLDEVTHPDRLDEAWMRGMDRRDVRVDRAGDGYHLTGFVDLVLGAKLQRFLVDASAPRGNGCDGESRDHDGDTAGAGVTDDRLPSQRRADALHALIDAALDHGLPGQGRRAAQLHVTVDAEWLAGQPAGEPPELEGVGPIGPDLYGYLACGGDHTTILTHGTTGGPTPYAAVLNVGRTRRLATPKQRRAVQVRQRGRCAAPGCRHTALELHHVAWWTRDGGATDFDNLVGLCRACHMSVHAQRLHVAADGRGGFVFRRTRGRARVEIEDRERRARQRLRAYLAGLGAASWDQSPSSALAASAWAAPGAAPEVAPGVQPAPRPVGPPPDGMLRHLRRHTTSPRT